jgi:hypothetical protein
MSAPPVSKTSPHVQDQYLGAIPEYIKWRNYTCDCLDVLHWGALSLSAKAGGLESPVFLHLHLSRLLILVPIRELLEHSYANVQGDASSNLLPHNLYQPPRPGPRWWRTILTWAHQDRYKARLAVVHAGSVFWHVRRYASYSLMEPFTVFLAALVLWAFASASRNTDLERQHPGPIATCQTQREEQRIDDMNQQASRSPPDLHRSNDDYAGSVVSLATSVSSSSLLQGTCFPSIRYRRMPNMIQLDRPIDDELVQHFIRSGNRMRLYLEGVDDLCSPEGPAQVLQEAISILLEQPLAWTISESYAKYLEGIIF